jgi:hypothetical protein
MSTLPKDRQMLSGRTFARSWGPDMGEAFEGPQRAALNVWDVLGWVGAAALIAGALALVYVPGWLECFGQLVAVR